MDIHYLKEHWKNLTSELPQIKHQFLDEVISLYSSPKRHYHNLDHIEALLRLYGRHEQLLNAPNAVNFAIWYHDAIYNASKNDNEKKSAELAQRHLSSMGVAQKTINQCSQLIMATKNHELPEVMSSFDIKFFLDIDLSILASTRKAYMEYTKQIRREYSIYPDFLYYKGRKKVLQHFLNMETIYKTELFQNLWEETARNNILHELNP